jgi:hypothetical protein
LILTSCSIGPHFLPAKKELVDRLNNNERSLPMTAERMMLIGGLAAFLLTLHWVRRRRLREKYAVVWMSMACGLLLLGMFPQVLMQLATAAKLSYPAAVLFISLAVIYLFSMSVSLSLSRARATNTRLTQELALLRADLEALRQAVQFGSHPTTGPSPDKSM